MGRKSRTKGYRGEKEIVDKLRSYGIKAERVPLSGAAGGRFAGDVIITIGTRDIIAEVKRRAKGFAQLYKWLADKDVLFVRSDRHEWLVIERFDDWVKRLKRR